MINQTYVSITSMVHYSLAMDTDNLIPYRPSHPFGYGAGDEQFEIASPDGHIRIGIKLERGELSYAVSRDATAVITPSRLGIRIADAQALSDDFVKVDAHVSTYDDTWEQPWGDTRIVRNHYNELSLTVQEFNPPRRQMTLTFRAFNDGAAFRYELPFQDNLKTMTIVDELTEFNTDAASKGWWIEAYQYDRYEYIYQKTTLSDLDKIVHTPFTVEHASGLYFSIHEAALYDYGSMCIAVKNGNLTTDITPLADGTRSHNVLPFVTPWRTISIAERAIDLTASTMMLNLNKPTAIQDLSWIKPMKYMGIWWAMHTGMWTWESGERHGATTEHAIQYIDACHEYGIPGLLIEGWNIGWDGDWMQNGDKFDYTTPYPDFDISKICAYAREKNVEIIGHHETSGSVARYERKMDDAFRYYANLGVRYVKLGYVGSRIDGTEFHHSQYGVRHYQKAVEAAAKYKIMVDIHEPIKGTGIERTWPNLMTREGASGQEHESGINIPPHTATLPFTRCLAGGFDYTPGIFDILNPDKQVCTTIAKQLALYVTIYSSLQMAADRPEMYRDNPAFKFIQDVPCDWDMSVPIDGVIGGFFATARRGRNSSEWYVGAVTNENERRVTIICDFLDKDRQYEATIYRDGDDAHWQKNPLSIAIDTQSVDNDTHLSIHLAPGGGCAIRFSPLPSEYC